MNKSSNRIKKIIIIIIAILLALALLTGLLLIIKKMKSKPVNVYNIEYISTTAENTSTSTTWGIVRAENIQSVYLSSTQKITEVLVKDGQSVKKGDAILKFDTTLSDLQLEKQKIAVMRIENNLNKAKDELKEINRLRPYVPAKPQNPSENYEPHDVPEWLSGTGTEEDPMIYLIDDANIFTHTFIEELFNRAAIEQYYISQEPDNDPVETPLPSPSITDSPEPSEIPVPSASPESSPLPSPSSESEIDPIVIPDEIYVSFEIHDQNIPEYELLNCFGIRFKNNSGSYSFEMFEPSSFYSGSGSGNESTIEEGAQYTATEIAQMKKNSQDTIKQLELELKVAQLEEKRIELELSDGTIYAENDGKIINLITEEEASESGSPLLVIDGGGGYHVSGSLNELELSLVSVGDSVNINDWMSGNNYSGIIVSISDMPSDNSSAWSNMNRNSSYYSFDVEIEKGANLTVDQSVDITYTPGGDNGGFYLENSFIRKENGNSFVYISDGGILRKCQVETGGSLWNSYTQILSGLSRTEGTRIAFPYGSDVKDGAVTRDAEIDELYQY